MIFDPVCNDEAPQRAEKWENKFVLSENFTISISYWREPMAETLYKSWKSLNFLSQVVQIKALNHHKNIKLLQKQISTHLD